ncbi:MAG: WYL domain-containing protein [Desulfovibrio sp.]|nr:WYL domain-containing protein [Desulfovibrio sp.]
MDLAEQYHCSKATIIRMVETIEVSGVAEIISGIEETGRRKGSRWYQLKNLPGTPHIGLTQNEVEKLAQCRDLLEHLLPEGIERVISEGIAKVATLMEKAEKRGETIASKAKRVVWGRIDYTPFQKHIECLLRAIPAHTACAVEYRIPGHEAKAHDFVPVRFTAENDALNIDGWNVNGKGTPEIRFPMTLAVHRILACSSTRRMLTECPVLPSRGGVSGLPGREGFPVRIAFIADYSGFIRERVWSEGQEVVELADGVVELRFQAGDEEELLRWALSFGSGAELLEPEHLRYLMREEVLEMMRYYASNEESVE